MEIESPKAINHIKLLYETPNIICLEVKLEYSISAGSVDDSFNKLNKKPLYEQKVIRT